MFVISVHKITVLANHTFIK